MISKLEFHGEEKQKKEARFIMYDIVCTGACEHSAAGVQSWRLYHYIQTV